MLTAETLARFRALKPGYELTLTRRFAQSADKLFAALSIPERIADWMEADWTGDPAPLRVGSRFSYRFRDSDMASEGRVTEFEPGRLIAHTWFENLPPAAFVRWTVALEGEGSTLTLTQSYPAADDATRNGAGWTMILGRLDAWLAGTPFQPPPGGWKAARDRYARAFGPAAIHDGRRATVEGRPVVRFERLVPAPVGAVWSWLTVPDKLKGWLGDVDVELRPGGAYRIRFTMAPIVMEGTITEVDPPRRLALIWREPWFENDDVTLAFDLAPHAEGTLLSLTHTFPAGYDPAEYLTGWHEFLDALDGAVRGDPPLDWSSPERKQRFETLTKVYAATAGGEAG